MKLSARLAGVSPSATIAVKQEADRLRAEGIDIIDFGPGEPDFDTPDNVKAAAHRAIDENLSHYLPTLGLPALRRAVTEHYRSLYGTDYDQNEVIVSCGGKSSLFAAMMALFGAGDEVIVPAPYWVSFPEQIRIAGATPVILPCTEAEGFVPTARRAAELMTPATRGVILCSPSNPTGAVIPEEELGRFAELALEKNLYLIFDECYEKFLYDGSKHASLASRHRSIRDRLVLVSTLSKSYAMTGYRVGYAVADRPVVAGMAVIQSHDSTHATAVAQAASVEALTGPQDAMDRMIAEYGRRRELIVSALAAMPGVTCPKPAGAFYVFPGVEGLCRTLGLSGSVDLAKHLLKEARIATVPGEAFGMAGHLRLSYALSEDLIREGMSRLAAVARR